MGTAMRPIDFGRLKELVSIDKVLDLLGWRHATVEGINRRGPCPVHRSTNPESRSFAAGPQGWFCHTCKRGGDQLRLWAEATRAEPLPAALELCRRLGIDPPFLPRRPRQPRAPRNRGEER
jgi:hypothetical protein